MLYGVFHKGLNRQDGHTAVQQLPLHFLQDQDGHLSPYHIDMAVGLHFLQLFPYGHQAFLALEDIAEMLRKPTDHAPHRVHVPIRQKGIHDIETVDEKMGIHLQLIILELSRIGLHLLLILFLLHMLHLFHDFVQSVVDFQQLPDLCPLRLRIFASLFVLFHSVQPTGQMLHGPHKGMAEQMPDPEQDPHQDKRDEDEQQPEFPAAHQRPHPSRLLDHGETHLPEVYRLRGHHDAASLQDLPFPDGLCQLRSPGS